MKKILGKDFGRMMKDKLRVLVVGIHYPLSMMSYFLRALERRDDVEIITAGPFTGNWIPWNNGMYVSQKYVKSPTISLPKELIRVGQVDPNMLQIMYSELLDNVDLCLEIDAGFYLNPKPKNCIVAHVATDPHCVSGDTLIATNQGILYPEELMGYDNLLVSDKTGQVRCDGVFRNGLKVTRKIVLETGQELVCTDDHKIEVCDVAFDGNIVPGFSRFVEAKDVEIGDKVLLSCGTYTPSIIDSDVDYSVGFILGSFQGDGSFGNKGFVKFTLSKEKKRDLSNSIKEHLHKGFGIDTVTEGKHYTCESAVVLQIRRWGLYRFLKSLDLKSGHIPLYIRKGSKSLIGGYLSGLFASDGCFVEGKPQLTTKWDTLARELQTVLFYLGVPSSNREVITNSGSYKPGLKYHTLYIRTGLGLDRFSSLVGNVPGKEIKQDSRRRGVFNGSTQSFSVTKIEGAVKNFPDKRSPEPVYDVINSESETFLANGISVHNCLNYDKQRSLSDYFFCMQEVYMKKGDYYLPYAYDPTVHFPVEVDPSFDACLIGLHYEQRNNLVNRLRYKGLNVYYDIGPIFDEYRELVTKSKVGMNWSSLLDLNARAFELPAMKVCPVMNTVPDMPNFLTAGVDYLSFNDVDEAEKQVLLAVNDVDLRKEISTNAFNKIQGNTYDMRIEQILRTTGLIKND